MPLLNLRCPEGHEWEALKSFSTHDEDAVRCPVCKSTQIESVPGGFRGIHSDGKDKRPEDYDPDTLQMILENKQNLERDSAKILSGEIGISERGPGWSRPQLPEHLKKRYF